MIIRILSFEFSVFSKKLIYLLILLFSANAFSQGYKIPEKPKEQTSVYDYYKLLSVNERQSLESKLIRYSDTTSTQIVVAIIASTEGENIGYLGANWLAKWGIGDAKKDNGILILLAKDDRKVFINTGYGIEYLLTDFASKQIVESEIIPEFKKGNFYAGLDKGVDAIFETLNGEYKGTRKEKKKSSPNFILFIIIGIIFILIISRGNKNNKGGRRKRSNAGNIAGSILEAIILSSAGRGGFGGGSFGGGSSSGGSFGGGFSGGFGGGSGGGGGAGGSW